MLIKSGTKAFLATVFMLGLSHGAGAEPAKVLPTPVDPKSWPVRDNKPITGENKRALEARIDSLMKKMTLEEKVAQMIQAEIKSATPEDVAKYGLGSILNGGGSFPNQNINSEVTDWLKLTDRYHKASLTHRLKIPVIWGTDAVHGHNNVKGATLFPHNINFGAANNPELTREIAKATAAEVRDTGIVWTFAPTIAVNDDVRWGRAYESYSSDQKIVASLGRAFVEGLQGSTPNQKPFGSRSVIATAKHFIGDGGTLNGVDQGETQGDETRLRDQHGLGYYAALDAQAQTVMISFSSWKGVKMHAQKGLITDILKGRLGFDGLVVSDWNGIAQIPGCSNSSCPEAVNAGIDLLMVPDDWKALLTNTVAQVKSGEISQARIDDAVRRILRVKIRSGLMDMASTTEKVGKSVGSPAHRALARDMVRQSMVLLKNRGILPLKPQSTVYVTGSGARSIARQSGGWTLTWQGTETTNDNFPGATTIFDGIKTAVEAAGGKAVYVEDASSIKAKDVVIAIYGEDPYAEGKGDLPLLHYSAKYPNDLKLLKAFKAKNAKIVSVFLSGRPMWVNPELNASDAFVAAFLPGSEGAGVADLLFMAPDGKIAHDFKGKLSFDWPIFADFVDLNDEGTILFKRGSGMSYKDKPYNLIVSEETGIVGPTEPAAKLPVLFERGPQSPFAVYAGDTGGWHNLVSGGVASSPKGIVKLTKTDHLKQEDAQRAQFNGKGLAQIFLQSNAPQDWSSHVQKGEYLGFSYKVSKRPTKDVNLRIDCVWPCSGQTDMTALMKAAPLDQWVKATIDMKCLAKSGLNPKSIDTGFLISTEGALDVSFSYVMIEPASAQKATLSC
jgi:beta-glucosidase